MAFAKGQGGRPKGVKNKQSKARENRATRAAAVAAAVAGVKPSIRAVPNARMAKAEAITPKDVLLTAMRDAWEASQRLNAESETLTARLQILEAKLADVQPDPVIEDTEKRMKEFHVRQEIATDAAELIRARREEVRGAARQALLDATGWAKDAAPYEHAKVAPESAKVDSTLTIIRREFVITPAGRVESKMYAPMPVTDVEAEAPKMIEAVTATPTVVVEEKPAPPPFKGRVYHVV